MVAKILTNGDLNLLTYVKCVTQSVGMYARTNIQSAAVLLANNGGDIERDENDNWQTLGLMASRPCYCIGDWLACVVRE